MSFIAKLDYVLKNMFEDKPVEEVRKEVSEKYGVPEQELVLRKNKYNKDKQEELETGNEDDSNNEESFEDSINSNKGVEDELLHGEVGIDLEDSNNEDDKVINLQDYQEEKDVNENYDNINTNNTNTNNNINTNTNNKKSNMKRDYVLEESDVDRVKRLAYVIKNDFQDFQDTKIESNINELSGSEAYNISFIATNKKEKVSLVFGIYYVYDRVNDVFLYQQGDSRVETKPIILKAMNNNVELKYILERYLVAMRLNNKID